MIGKNIDLACKHLQAGRLVAIPTETVYGLAGNIYLPEAIRKIFEVKKRPFFNPLIVHIDSFEKAYDLVSQIPDEALMLAEKHLPGPLTLVLPKSNKIHPLITGGVETVAFRIPDHPLTLLVLEVLKIPLVAPSANPSGYISPTKPQHVEELLGDKIAYILDGGICKLGIESTIVAFKDTQVIVLRKGALTIEAIEKTIGKKVKEYISSNIKAPGMLKKHYAPKTKMIVGDIKTLIPRFQGKNIGILSFSNIFKEIKFHNQFVLSPTRSYEEAAKNLFSYMRALDKRQFDIILAELLPEENLGSSINDRLRRGAEK